MRKIDKKSEEEIIQMYNNGLSIQKISNLTIYNGTTIYNVLKRNGVNTRTKGGIQKLDNEEIIKQYKDGESTSNIAKKYNVTCNTIINILKNNNIDRNNLYHNKDLVENYWSEINSYDKAYFLGFLISDGNIMGNSVRLSLKSSDKNILEIFKEKTNNENKLYEDKRGFSTYSVKRKKWVEDLNQYGVIPNKTETVYVPQLKEEFMPHLLRGLIDGDGWVTTRGQIGICGNEQTVTQVRDYIVNKLNVYNVKVIQCKRGNLYMCNWASKKDFVKICEFLYNDKKDCFLERKFNNYQFVIHDNTEVSSEMAQGSETP